MPKDGIEGALENEGRKAGLQVYQGDGAPVIQISADLAKTARELGEVVSRLDLFDLNGKAMFFDHRGELTEMTPQRFRTWIHEHVVVCRAREKDTGQPIPDTLYVDEAAAVLQAERFRRHLRRVERINRVRLPVIRGEEVVWLPWGYDEGARCYTVPGGLEYDGEIPLEVAKGWFHRYFGSFPFSDDRSQAVQLAAMLAGYVRHMMPAGCLRKGFLWKANKSDSGKSVAAKAALYPVMGSAAAAKMKKREELDKELEAFARAASSYLFLDNVYGSLVSATLDQMITSRELTFRGMGGHGIVTVPWEGLVMVTGNNLEANEDAARRFLLIDLFTDDEAGDRDIPAPLDDDLMASAEWRREALGMLCALVKHWDAAGRPAAPTVDRTFAHFTGILGGIVTAAGYADPIAKPNQEDSLTPDQAEFRQLLAAMLRDMGDEAEKVWTLEALAQLARAEDIFVSKVGTAEQGKKLVIKEDGLKGEERAFAEDLGYLTPSQRQKWNDYLKNQVGQKPLVGDRVMQFGARSERRKTAYTVTVK